MGRPVGRVYESSISRVLISLYEHASVNVGDVLYVKQGSDRYLLLHVDDVVSKLPSGASRTLSLLPESVEPSGAVIETARERVAVTTPTLTIVRESNGEVSVVRATTPPRVNEQTYLLENGDPESQEIMLMFSHGISWERNGQLIPLGILRSGTATSRSDRERKYFKDARVQVDLETLIPKHILVSGQTGAGKTTSIMGLMVNWAFNAKKPISWLVIDRHGEYSRFSGGYREEFLDKLVKALEANSSPDLSDIGVYVYNLTPKGSGESRYGRLVVKHTQINVGSLSLDDIAMALELSDEEASWLEIILETLENIVLASDMDDRLKQLFQRRGESLSGHLLPLLVAVVDNVCNYEGIGEREKKGVYREFVSQGIYINRLRAWRNRIVSLLNLTPRKITVNSSTITILDDSNSIFRVSEVFKDKHALRELLEYIVTSKAIDFRYRQSLTKYKWYGIDVSRETVTQLERGIDVNEIVEQLEKGNIVILNVSSASSYQADTLVLNTVRRILTERMKLPPDEARRRKAIVIVSEEAPLYLSPEKVKSPRNAFARVAREGRKFNVGLIAITQLATMIERQLLANMNTLIILRTKYRADIDYFSSIGVPADEIPRLNDREGYLYTPDVKVREPIPVYFPGWFEVELESKSSERAPESFEEFARMIRGV
ncbi:MAG TPA: DUF87 domain-containing protein [Desulfurococcales archaeon]|nr:DUF87 domain-containing protein [Desulfurococcales archaeon]